MNPGQWVYYHVFNKPPGARTVLPIGQSILAGLIVFAVIFGVALLVAHISYNAGMGALVVLAVAGLSFGYRSGMLAVLGATFVALLPAAMAVGGVGDYAKAKAIRSAEVTPAEMPRTDTDVFVVKDFRVATELVHVYRTQRTIGGKPDPVFYGVAPLVPAAWQKGEPVPAWLSCTGSEESWCTHVLGYPLRGAKRVDARDHERYRAAVVAAAQRHGLAAAAAPLVVHHIVTPEESASGAMGGMIVMPILGFIVWLLGFLLWRAIRPAKAVARMRA